MLTEYLKTDMQLAWQEWSLEREIEPPAPIPAGYERAYHSGVCALRWLLQDARQYIAGAEPSPARDRLLERLEQVGA